VYLQYVCHVASIGLLVQQKSDDHSLIALHPKSIWKRFSERKWEKNCGVNRMLETDLIYSTFRMVHILETGLRETRTPELIAGSWPMFLSTR
jgi:hypothetical protein